jgi:hypothetical protein
MGTSEELKAQTNTNNLEEAYLALTGKGVRDETLDRADGRKEVIRSYVRSRNAKIIYSSNSLFRKASARSFIKQKKIRVFIPSTCQGASVNLNYMQ